MFYRVVTTPDVDEQLEQAVAHIANIFCDVFAATNLLKEAQKTINSLKVFPRGHVKYTDGPLTGYYKARVGRYNYIILYRIKYDLVIVEELHHMSEDYENTR